MAFAYLLAAHLGIEDADRMMCRMSVRQLRRWAAAYRLQPFGDDWRRSARQTVVMASAMGAKVSEHAEEMFLPSYDGGEPVQSEAEMMRELMKIPAAIRNKGKA